MWIGCLKFTAYEAEGVYKHASNSPLLSWGYLLLSVRGLSTLLGIIEVTLAALIALKPIAPKLSIFGSLGAIARFLTSLTLVFTTPGVWQKDYGFLRFPRPPGRFLIKDVVLLAAARVTQVASSLR
ncbi:MAG: DUF417 family protein [Chthoniobacterales bacterium]|nr:DUF417 family protein [Chthoniobacterales bacterium]MBA3831537.1 DUF417 family protein [Chthoniobacterales bacterium]